MFICTELYIYIYIYTFIYMFICTELIEETTIPRADFWPGSDKFES